MRKTIIQSAQRIIKSPFIKKFIKATFWVTAILAASMDIQKSFFTSMNSTLPTRSRAVAAVRGSSCFGALIISYFASKTPNPQLKMAFLAWCHILGLTYVLSGGDMGLSFIFIYNAKH